jgi:hypothetical protein
MACAARTAVEDGKFKKNIKIINHASNRCLSGEPE